MNAVSIMAACITFIAMLFVAPLLGCLFGAFSGWVVSLFWDYEVLNFMARIGIDTQGLTLWQTGAALDVPCDPFNCCEVCQVPGAGKHGQPD